MKRTLKEVVIIPGHVKRTESKEFRDAKKRLKADGHDKCYVGQDCKGGIQYHHYGCEWSLWADCDPELLKEFLMEWDIYGYSRLLKDKPITSPDDVRNLMALCELHHIEVDHGIHEITFPVWVIQKNKLANTEPVV